MKSTLDADDLAAKIRQALARSSAATQRAREETVTLRRARDLIDATLRRAERRELVEQVQAKLGDRSAARAIDPEELRQHALALVRLRRLLRARGHRRRKASRSGGPPHDDDDLEKPPRPGRSP